MENPVVNVLLSTYNGEKYLKEQLDSVLSQVNVDVRLYIRDDGSQDDTVMILQEYSSRFSNICLFVEQNIGCVNSFLRLIELAENDEAHGFFFAFCDQDDVWDSDKLYCAIKMMDSQDSEPILYCSNLRIVDSHLKLMKLMYESNIYPMKGRSLVANICTGCTIVMNHHLVDFYNSLNFEVKGIVMHDWLFYNLAIFKGHVIYDNIPHILYRQHISNVVGANKTDILTKCKHFASSLFNRDKEHYRESQAKTMLQLLKDKLCPQDTKLITLVALYRKNLLSRFRLILNRQICGNDISLRIRILLSLI